MAKKKFDVIDLFCGAGGMTHGFHRAGFRTVAAAEKSAIFADTYEANYGIRPIVGDIENSMSRLECLRADVVIGGPPCQGFSSLTGNKPSDPRRSLWRYYMDVVRTSKCEVFVLENVPNILSSDEGRAICEKAARLGYEVTSRVLLASNFGVPQNRKRAFIVGSKIGPIELPEGNGKVTTVREAFAGIPPQPNAVDFARTVSPVRTDALHIPRNPTAISLQRYRAIPPGGNRFDLLREAPEITPQCLKRKDKGTTDVFGRLDWDRPARCTIRTEFYKPEKGRYLHPEEHRPITHWEAARLQTFPDDYLWVGSKIEIAVQIGNAVPPELAKVIAETVAAKLRNA